MTKLERKAIDALKTFLSAQTEAGFDAARKEARAVIAEAESANAIADADGWIPWSGGVQFPVPPFTTVQVKFRNLVEAEEDAHEFNWEIFGDLFDIIAYRIVKEPT